MKNNRVLLSNIAMVVLIGLFFYVPAFAQEAELTIIANPESVPNELTMKKLKSILRGEQQKWEDGVSIKLALMKTGTPIGASTCKKIYGMSANELNKYFLALVFQGKGKAPVFFNSIAEMETYVTQTPGAIGVSQSSSDNQIKIVLIDGQKQIQ
jgi:ABC-type phosphate transport system substrate-binding protein